MINHDVKKITAILLNQDILLQVSFSNELDKFSKLKPQKEKYV